MRCNHDSGKVQSIEGALVLESFVAKQINVIVTSTRRKRASVPERLYLRDLKERDFEERATEWIDRLKSLECRRVEAQELYAGDHWQIARSLPQVGKATGWNVCLWICSPGYGLIKPESLVGPYSATFSMTHPDSVTKPVRREREVMAQRWWARLAEWRGPSPDEPRTIANIAASAPSSPLVVVASQSIITILEHDLKEAAEQLKSDKNLLILSGGTNDRSTLAKHLLPCNARLQPLFGGARMSLNVRALRHLLSKPAPADDLRVAWTNILAEMLSSAPRPQRYDRVSLKDDEIRSFILEGFHRDQTVSRSRLLRHLRDSGYRCEEKRFKSLFERLLTELD